jgi:hypothetical protein
VISGVIPAIPLILIRPFLPESPEWAARKAAGSLQRPSIAELFAPKLRRTTIVTTLMFACCYGAAFGALQQTPSIVPGLPQVVEQTRDMPVPQRKATEQMIAAEVNGYQEIGGLLGRFALASLALVVVSRRWLLRIFQWPGLVIVPLVYFFPARNDLHLLQWGIFAAGFLTVAQFSFWGNYLPRVFPTHLRGTGESFAANIGGRMIGTSFAAVTAWVTTFMPGGSTALAAGWLGGALVVRGRSRTVVLSAGTSERFLTRVHNGRVMAGQQQHQPAVCPDNSTRSSRRRIGDVIRVVTIAMMTMMQKIVSGMTPRSRPIFTAINPIRARVFIIMATLALSRHESPLSRAAAPQPTTLPTIATVTTRPHTAHKNMESSVPISVLNPV